MVRSHISAGFLKPRWGIKLATSGLSTLTYTAMEGRLYFRQIPCLQYFMASRNFQIVLSSVRVRSTNVAPSFCASSARLKTRNATCSRTDSCFWM